VRGVGNGRLTPNTGSGGVPGRTGSMILKTTVPFVENSNASMGIVCPWIMSVVVAGLNAFGQFVMIRSRRYNRV
jgi:hypothetical protein